MKRSRIKRRRAITRRSTKRWAAKDQEEAAAFRDAVIENSKGFCARCRIKSPRLQAHHLCSRARGVGHPLLHDHRNGAALCLYCHDTVHFQNPPDMERWILSRDHLETLLELDGQPDP